jgi:anthranilate synthase component 2
MKEMLSMILIIDNYEPKEAVICVELVKELKSEYPIFGFCLGHQVIGQVFGANVISAGRILHGKMDNIIHTNQTIFQNTKPMFKATRYHSLMIDHNADDLEVIATAKSDNIIMAVQHKEYPIFGVQFHPESYATECGKEIIDSFLNIVKISKEGNYEHSKIS